MVDSVVSKTRRNASVDLLCVFIMQGHVLLIPAVVHTRVMT